MTAASTGAAMLSSCTDPQDLPGKRSERRVLVVAFDGLDPRILESLMRAGKMPAFEKLSQMGSFKRLGTTMPPQTPVAFSSIITGTPPGVHQIFDFIHRDPNPKQKGMAIRPHFSTAEAAAPESQWAATLGNWRLPLANGETHLLRRGKAFWEYLVQAGVDTDVFYLPANYPVRQVSGSGRFRSITGMGTPDILGGYGEFTLLTPDAPRQGRSVGGGRIALLAMHNNRGSAKLIGPPNFLRSPNAAGRIEPMSVSIEVVRDSSRSVAKIRIGEVTALLNDGEWSDWIPVEFQTGIPGSIFLRAVAAPTSIRGMVRLFLQSVHPKLVLYVSPVNIDPLAAYNPISAPGDFAASLGRKHGRFSTLGIPEDTQALRHGALDEQQFLAQADLVIHERIEQYRAALKNFTSGCLLFYFGATDLLQHMFWRDRDPLHPGRDPEQAQQFGRVIDDLYVSTDRLVADALDTLGPDDTLIVLSDHGFTSFRRGLNVNSWLSRNGFMKFKNGAQRWPGEMFAGVDWSATKAYALGMNAVYVNQRGREKFGNVKESSKGPLLRQLRNRLMQLRDIDGTRVLDRIDVIADLDPNADPLVAPDMILGFADGYRASWSTTLGGGSAMLIEDNLDRWSGTHLIAPERVPGILLTNRAVAVSDPNVLDIAPTILEAFGLPTPQQMPGRPLFKTNTAEPKEIGHV